MLNFLKNFSSLCNPIRLEKLLGGPTPILRPHEKSLPPPSSFFYTAAHHVDCDKTTDRY